MSAIIAEDKTTKIKLEAIALYPLCEAIRETTTRFRAIQTASRCYEDYTSTCMYEATSSALARTLIAARVYKQHVDQVASDFHGLAVSCECDSLREIISNIATDLNVIGESLKGATPPSDPPVMLPFAHLFAQFDKLATFHAPPPGGSASQPPSALQMDVETLLAMDDKTLLQIDSGVLGNILWRLRYIQNLR